MDDPDRTAEQNADAPSTRQPLWHLPHGRMPWVTLAAIAISAVATVMWFMARDATFLALYANGDEVWLRWRWRTLFGAGFIHSGPLHLLFNGYWLWIFGRVLEPRLGAPRFLLLFLFTLWSGSVGELAWSGNPGIGLSGVVYGLFGFLTAQRQTDAEFKQLLPGAVMVLMWGWLGLCFFLTSANILPVANGAHVAGLVAGALFGAALLPGRWTLAARIGAAVVGGLSFVPLFWAPWQDGWIAAQAYRALEQRDFETALRWCGEIKAGRYDEWARKNESNIRQYHAAVAKDRDALLLLAENSRDPHVLNNVAWRLATSPHDRLRDGARAVALANRACEIDGWKSAAFIDTLAAAHAEAGDFGAAEKWMQRALENPQEHVAILEKHLAAFRAHQRWREPEAAAAPQKNP